MVTGFTVAWLVPGVGFGEEKSLDEWAGQLGSGDPAIRRRAEQELGDPDAVLGRLAGHPDPWVAARATRLLMERRGIDTRIPHSLQLAVLDFETLGETRRNEVIEELIQSGPGHLNALAFLHNRAAAGKAFTDGETRLWQQRFQSCVRTNLPDAETLRPELLSLATRALLLSSFPENMQRENAQRYSKWRALDPSIRLHLTGRAVVLEIDHLKEHTDTTGILEYLPQIADPKARQEAARRASDILSKDEAFKAEGLGESAAIGHLILLMRQGGSHQAASWYEKHLAAHPGIAARLPTELAPLEGDRLLKAGNLSSAIEWVLKLQALPDQQSPVDYRMLGEIAKALGTKPETLPDGLPAMPDPQSLPGMGRLLSAWFPMSRPSRGYSDIDAKVECFDRWAGTGEWLEAARRFGPHPLYHLVMARRGKMNEVLLTHEFERESAALKNLGALILMQPSVARDLPARQCSLSTLQDILDGGFSSFNPGSPVPGPLLDLATEWSTFYPDLLAPGSFPTQPLYQAAIAWRKGELQQASAALLDCTKPIPNDAAPKQPPRPNPLASAAISLLANLLAENSKADIPLLLPPDRVDRETLQAMLDRLVRLENRTPGQVSAAMAISALLRERFDINEPKPLFSPHEARSFALDAWMSGDAKLAGDFLLQAYLTTPDPEEHYDSVFAPTLKLLGRAEETLAELDTVKANMPATIHPSKRARLLRELGRTKEAMECVSSDHHPQLRLRLAIETGDWNAAIRSTLDFEDDAKKREAMNACIAIFSGQPELMNRHTAGKHPVVNLLKGNGIREDDLAQMARDAELLSRLEARLTAALASGEPIRTIDMSGYFQHLDLLPDRQRAVLLAVELAKRDFSVFSSPSSGEKLTGHKVLAAETLLLLGRGELAFGAMRPLMEASVDPHAFKGIESGAVSGGLIRVVAAGYRQATRIAHFEWPEDTPAARMDRLAAILENKDPLARTRGMIDLVSKHQARLEKTDLLQALHLPLLDLAHAGEVPQALKETTRALLQSREPSPQETRWLESQWTRVPWTDETRHRPSKGKSTSKVTFTPKPGSNSNPEAPGFVIIDGLSAATKLHKQGKADAARDLLRDITVRVLLDSDMMRQEVEWNHQTQSPAGSHSSTFGTRGLLTLLTYFDLLDAPSGQVSGVTDACANPWTNYSDAKRLHRAARVMAKAGDHRASLAHYRRFLAATVPAFGSEDIGLSGRKEIAEMHRIRGIIAADEGDSATAADAVLQLVQTSPYQPEEARDIADMLRKKGNKEAIQSARSAIDGFWRVRLLEIPASETYQYWKKQWAELFP